jgi:hypothetical protein
MLGIRAEVAVHVAPAGGEVDRLIGIEISGTEVAEGLVERLECDQRGDSRFERPPPRW